jgi:predicted RND superfamily exporter protein
MENLNDFFKKLFYYFHNNSIKVIIFSTILFSFLLFQSLNLKQAVTITDQMDPNEQSTKDIKHTSKTFDQNSSIGIIIAKENKQFFSFSELCKIQLDISNIIYNTNFIENYNSPFKIRTAKENNSTLTYERFIPNPCESIQNSSFTFKEFENTPWKRLFTGNDGLDLAYNFSFSEITESGRYGHFEPKRVEEFMGKIFNTIKYKIYWTGPEVVQYFTITGLNQSQWLNFVVIAIIWISLRLYFGTWRAGAIYLLTLIFSATVIFGGMALFNHPIDMLSSCLFLLLSISSLQDFLFVASHQLESKNNYIESHLKLITPSFFTTLTTVLGFSSLCTSRLLSIQRFGLWASIGSLVEWISVFLIIPAFMAKFPSWQKWVSNLKAMSLNKARSITIKSPSLFISRILLIFFVFAFYSTENFRLSQTPSEMFPKNHPYQQMIEYVRKNRLWEADASLIFDKNVSLVMKNRIINILKADKSIFHIETYDEVSRFILKDILNPQSKELVKHEIKLSSFSKRYFNDENEERSILLLNTTNTEKINLLRDKVKLLCPKRECYLTGEIIGFADFSKSLIHTLFSSLFVSLLLVSITIAFLVYISKNKNFINIILSSFWGPAVLLCSIYIFDISINFVTCIVASTLVGLTGDNAIQFLFASREKNLDEGIKQRSISSLYCSMTMALCSLTFLGSYFDAPKTLGLLLAGGFILSYVGDVWLLKGLLKVNSKK